jgi:starvation-inducible DNA-binding protein
MSRVQIPSPTPTLPTIPETNVPAAASSNRLIPYLSDGIAAEMVLHFKGRITERRTKIMPKEATAPAKERHHASDVPTDLNREGVAEITSQLRELLADTFALYMKTKNFHWHMTGRHFRDYHLLLDEHADQIFAMTDDIAERARKIGGTTLRSISDISRHQRLEDSNAESVPVKDMLAQLLADNQALTKYFRSTHETCDKYNDVATASLIEVWIDQTERRTWFLAEIVPGL